MNKNIENKHKKSGTMILVSICVSYTILSIINALLALFSGRESGSHMNSIMMLVWTSIAVLILNIHSLFDEWSPILMIVIQYLIAMGLVLLTIFLSGFFEEISPNGYRDAIISFTIPYIIGAAVYYISVFAEAKRQDQLIQEINAADRT
ncbi:MAG: DUF3021 family protein [Clostridia bacterium]|nr:DUF3021 family protein [Clostridia bacterium]